MRHRVRNERKGNSMMITRLWRNGVVLTVAAMLLVGGSLVRAQGMTQEQAKEMLIELKAIRQAVERTQQPGQPAPAPDDKVSMALPPGGFSMGQANAPLVMVEYTDYQCPFCQTFHNTTFAQIKTNYIDTGKLRFVSRDFPLDFHENARRAAGAARCAAEQGKYWEMRHVMIVNAEQLKVDNLMNYASNVSLDVPKFKTCLDSDKFRADIDKNIAEGTAAGINGTPSFVLGRVDNGTLQGVRLVGAMPYAQFDAKLQELLKQAKN